MSLVLNGNQYAEIPVSCSLNAGVTLFAFFKPGEVNWLSSIVSLTGDTEILSISVSALKTVMGSQYDLKTTSLPVDGWTPVVLRASSGVIELFTKSRKVKAEGKFTGARAKTLVVGASEVRRDLMGKKFDGEIANVRAWSQSLSDKDVETLVNARSLNCINSVTSNSLMVSNNFSGTVSGSNGRPDAVLVNGPYFEKSNPLPAIKKGRHPKAG